MAAAALRLLLRRRAGVPASPSQARLRPLLPGPDSKLRSAIPAAAAGGAGLQDARCSQASPFPVPHLPGHCSSKAAATVSLPDMHRVPPSPPQVPSVMIRHYSSKIDLLCRAPFMCDFMQQRSTLQSATASLPGSRRMQSSWYPGPSMIRHYSSKCCNAVMYTEADVMKWFLEITVKGMEEQYVVMWEALTTWEKGIGDKDYAMVLEGLYNFSSALAVLEKGLNDCTRIIGSCHGLPLDVVEKNRRFCKEMEDFLKEVRPRIKNSTNNAGTIKTMMEVNKMMAKVNKMMAIALAVGTGVPH
ncbi:hypothetical protein EJB05_03067, partial [Eragrostis curvula]